MAQIGCSASVRWKQTWQCRICCLAARIDSASSRASSAFAQEVMSEPFGGLGSDAGQASQSGNQAIDGRRIARAARHGQEPSSAEPGAIPRSEKR